MFYTKEFCHYSMVLQGVENGFSVLLNGSGTSKNQFLLAIILMRTLLFIASDVLQTSKVKNHMRLFRGQPAISLEIPRSVISCNWQRPCF